MKSNQIESPQYGKQRSAEHLELCFTQRGQGLKHHWVHIKAISTGSFQLCSHVYYSSHTIWSRPLFRDACPDAEMTSMWSCIRIQPLINHFPKNFWSKIKKALLRPGSPALSTGSFTWPLVCLQHLWHTFSTKHWQTTCSSIIPWTKK